MNEDIWASQEAWAPPSLPSTQPFICHQTSLCVFSAGILVQGFVSCGARLQIGKSLIFPRCMVSARLLWQCLDDSTAPSVSLTVTTPFITPLHFLLHFRVWVGVANTPVLTFSEYGSYNDLESLFLDGPHRVFPPQKLLRSVNDMKERTIGTLPLRELYCLKGRVQGLSNQPFSCLSRLL